MRAFIAFALISVASADVGGYTYGTAQNGGYAAGGNNGGGFIGNSGGSFGAGFPGSSFGSGSLGGDSFSGGSLGGGAPGNSFSTGSGGGSLGVGSYGAPAGGSYNAPVHHAAAPVTTEFNKEFFTFSAPEADFQDAQPIGDVNQSIKKNLRVIFIRAPENHGLNKAAINLVKHANEQKTAIYVLTKQSDISELSNKLHQINENHSNKPEVHFVKYRTPEDAQHAQHAIQQQYDGLEGPSQSHDGGVAPVLNFASKAPAAVHYAGPSAGAIGGGAIGGGSIGGGDNGNAPANTYIPPASVGVSGSPSATYLPIVKV